VSADDEIDRLLAAPLPTFVEERRRIAGALKAAGRRDDAKTIASINKPSLPVWVVNQLARVEGSRLTRLGVLTDELREVPTSPAASAGYAQLVTEHREALRALRAAAERVLAGAGHDAGPALLERIVHSLRAGMADREMRAAIESGRLRREIGEVDFTSMVGGGAGGDPPSGRETAPRSAVPAHATQAHAGGSGPREDPARERQIAAERTAQDRAHERAAMVVERERTRARAAADREVERLRNQTSAARRRLADEQRALESAQRGLEAANRALELARRTLGEKEERAEGARREIETAVRAQESAEAAAQALRAT
jgi:hypothetical protein